MWSGLKKSPCPQTSEIDSTWSKGVFTWDQDKLRPPYISFYSSTWDRPDHELNSDRSDFVSVVGSRREILKPGPEISSLYPFGSAIYLLEKTCRFIPKPGTKHLVPVSCKQLQKFHTSTSSYRCEFVPVSCKYPLSCRWRKLLCSSLTDMVCIMLLTVTKGGEGEGLRAPQDPPWLCPWQTYSKVGDESKCVS